MYKKIILPTDGSEYADREVARAKHLLAEDGEIIIEHDRKLKEERYSEMEKNNMMSMEYINNKVDLL